MDHAKLINAQHAKTAYAYKDKKEKYTEPVPPSGLTKCTG
jgi:hypothetical protein